jgi:hypothetical protein
MLTHSSYSLQLPLADTYMRTNIKSVLTPIQLASSIAGVFGTFGVCVIVLTVSRKLWRGVCGHRDNRRGAAAVPATTAAGKGSGSSSSISAVSRRRIRLTLDDIPADAGAAALETLRAHLTAQRALDAVVDTPPSVAAVTTAAAAMRSRAAAKQQRLLLPGSQPTAFTGSVQGDATMESLAVRSQIYRDGAATVSV